MSKIMSRRQTMFAKQDDEDKKASTSSRITSGRVKKTKVPFDPSDTNYPKRRQTICVQDPPKNNNKISSLKIAAAPKLPRAQSALLQPCAVQTCTQTKKTLPYVKCLSDNDCPNRIHLLCLKNICTNFSKGEELNWRCENCETCEVCYETALCATLYKCYVCMSFFHMDCHDTKITEADIVHKNRFRCSQCVMRAPTIRLRQIPLSSDGVVRSRRSSDADFEGFTDIELNDNGNISKGEQPERSENAGQLEAMQTENFNQTQNSSQSERAIQPERASQSERASLSERASQSETTRQPQSQTAAAPSTNAANKRHLLSYDAKNRHLLSFGVPFSEVVPDASKWTTDEVYAYFCQYFDSEVASVLKEHDVDGIALLLFKRKDILTRFDMKLGTALRIYSHVLRLQARVNDVRLGWN